MTIHNAPVESRDVWLAGHLAGELRRTRTGEVQFAYSPSWCVRPDVYPLSYSLPLSHGTDVQAGPHVAAFFENLLPDSDRIRARLARGFEAASTTAFDLLTVLGRDCAGAIEVTSGMAFPASASAGAALSRAELAEILRCATGGAGAADNDVHLPAVALAGAQEKTAFAKVEGAWYMPSAGRPSTHIFKVPLGLVGNMRADMSASVENEWLCAQLLAAYGLPVAGCEIEVFEGQKALVVERFDRRLDRRGGETVRVHQEDLCQAAGVAPEYKYESDGGPGIARALRLMQAKGVSEEDQHVFFTAQILFWMMGATDGHAKNFSLVLEGGRPPRLAPLYDVLSIYPILGQGANQMAWQRAKLAMAIRSKNTHYHLKNILRRHWGGMAARCGLNLDVEALLSKLVDRTPKVLACCGEGLPPGFPVRVADTIFTGLTLSAAKLKSGA